MRWMDDYWLNSDLNIDLTKALIEMINIKSYNEVPDISILERRKKTLMGYHQ
jgi:hypothetical protein